MATAPDYVPQFSAPFRLGVDGQPVTVEQDSLEEIGSCVYNVITCPQGAMPEDPEWGIPTPVFDLLNLDVAAITAAVQALEPRATISVVQDALAQVQHPQTVGLEITAQVPART